MKKISLHCFPILLAWYSNSQAIDVDLVPRSNALDCPNNNPYKSDLETCSCEDHCAWDRCRLADAPAECIEGIHSEWKWDYVRNVWVAQVIQGNIA